MSVWFEPSSGESEVEEKFIRHPLGNLAVPLEVLERIVQLIPVGNHHNVSRVCKTWRSVVKEPYTKREVILNCDTFEAAWKKQFNMVFAANVLNNTEPAVQAYGHILALWVMRFLSSHTRTLILTNELCSKAHLIWYSLLPLLEEKCPRLRKIVFQSGRITLDVLTKIPNSVEVVTLETCRVVKRHLVEGFTECILDVKSCPFAKLDYCALASLDVESYLRNLALVISGQ